MSVILVALVSYLLGSIPSGVIVSRAFGRADVRLVGSGHTGALNTFRAAGFMPAALTLAADGGKGIFAAWFAQWLTGGWAIPVVATLVVVGHCWPLFTRGRGGLGIATAGGVFLLLQPSVLLVLAAVWFLVKWIARESVYASLTIALLLPLLLIVLRAEFNLIAAGLGVGGVLLVRHWQVWSDRDAQGNA